MDETCRKLFRNRPLQPVPGADGQEEEVPACRCRFSSSPFTLRFAALTSYSKVLNHPAVGPISWAWVFAFAQFIMTWALCIIYSRQAAQYDQMIREIRSDAKLRG
ncbi:DUF485 domain-containing protein [Paenibacillus sp. P26]|nr:DUF485 domain-containing protein [Paenibacillus sp. P26]